MKINSLKHANCTFIKWQRYAIFFFIFFEDQEVHVSWGKAWKVLIGLSFWLYEKNQNKR